MTVTPSFFSALLLSSSVVVRFSSRVDVLAANLEEISVSFVGVRIHMAPQRYSESIWKAMRRRFARSRIGTVLTTGREIG